MFECGAVQVQRGSDRWHATMDVFERKFGEVIGLIRPLADFRMFALMPRRGVFVKGFGQAFRVEGPALDALRQVSDV